MLSSFFQKKIKKKIKKITIYWCMLIVYTRINGLIQGIASIIESLFFIIF